MRMRGNTDCITIIIYKTQIRMYVDNTLSNYEGIKTCVGVCELKMKKYRVYGSPKKIIHIPPANPTRFS